LKLEASIGFKIKPVKLRSQTRQLIPDPLESASIFHRTSPIANGAGISWRYASSELAWKCNWSQIHQLNASTNNQLVQWIRDQYQSRS